MRILIVEDQKQLAQNVAEYLRLEGFTVDVALDGASGLRQIMIYEYDLAILDRNLPEMDGVSLCKEARARGKEMSIIMLTAQSSLEDKITGLDAGADDYLTKPFDLEELGARIRAQIRAKSQEKKDEVVLKNGIRVDLTHKGVFKGGRKIKLSPKEYGILEYLIRCRRRAKNRMDILDHVWGMAGEALDLSSDTVEVHIAHIRKKLGKEIIKTERGYGYLVE